VIVVNKEIWLAGGCFWGVEEYFSRVNGAVETSVGHANGSTENPSSGLFEEKPRLSPKLQLLPS